MPGTRERRKKSSLTSAWHILYDIIKKKTFVGLTVLYMYMVEVRIMKHWIKPETLLGKWSVLLGILFIVFITLKMGPGFPLPTFAIAAIGIAGFVTGIISIVKKERSILVFLSVLLGLLIIAWIIGELVYPH